MQELGIFAKSGHTGILILFAKSDYLDRQDLNNFFGNLSRSYLDVDVLKRSTSKARLGLPALMTKI